VAAVFPPSWARRPFSDDGIKTPLILGRIMTPHPFRERSRIWKGGALPSLSEHIMTAEAFRTPLSFSLFLGIFTLSVKNYKGVFSPPNADHRTRNDVNPDLLRRVSGAWNPFLFFSFRLIRESRHRQHHFPFSPSLRSLLFCQGKVELALLPPPLFFFVSHQRLF